MQLVVARRRGRSATHVFTSSKMGANLLLKPSLIPRSSVIHFSSESAMATTLKVLGDRKRCKTLLSLKEEQYVASLIDVLLSRDKVCYDHWSYHWSLSLYQVLHAEPWLNKYRRQGHQFTVNVYNKLINSWLKQVCTWIIRILILVHDTLFIHCIACTRSICIVLLRQQLLWV